MKFSLVVAADKNNGIGKNNALVWKLPADMKFFADMTTNTDSPSKMNAVIMGRKTWESIPEKHRPLKDRYNIILSRDASNRQMGAVIKGKTIWAESLDAALNICSPKLVEKVFVIGGARVFEEAIKHPDCQTIYLTRLQQTFDCDVFFPQIDEKIFTLKDRSGIKHENNIDFEFLTYEREA